MEILVTYDVATADSAGARRLRRVAKICEAHGQRVQKSVFECTLSAAQKEQFIHALTQEIDEDEDSLRLYHLQQPREQFLVVLGKALEVDLHDPLIV